MPLPHVVPVLTIPVGFVLVLVVSQCVDIVIRAVMVLVVGIVAIVTKSEDREIAA